MKTIYFYLIAISYICLSSCSENEIISSKSNDKVERKNDDIVEIIYKDVKLYSTVCSDTSSVLFTNTEAEDLYRKVTEKEGTVISINSEGSWELFDSQEDYDLSQSNTSDSRQLKASSPYYLEMEAYATTAEFYEHDYYSGRSWKWSALNYYGIRGHYVCLDSIGLSRSISSFTIDNTSFSKAIQIYFFTEGCQLLATSKYSKAIVVQPRAKASVYSISKIWGSRYDDKATIIQISWWPPTHKGTDVYLLEDISYEIKSLKMEDKSVTLDSKYIRNPNYTSTLINIYLSGKYTDIVRFDPPSNGYLSPSNMLITGIPIPSINKKGELDIYNLTDFLDWRTEFTGVTQKKEREENIQQTMQVPALYGDTYELVGHEYKYSIQYTAKFRKRVTLSDIYIAKGILTVTTQANHHLSFGKTVIKPNF